VKIRRELFDLALWELYDSVYDSGGGVYFAGDSKQTVSETTLSTP
jgi:hypothetical protein